MTRKVEIYLSHNPAIELLDAGDFKELFFDAYPLFDNRDMRSLKTTLEEALEIDLTDITTACFLKKFKEIGIPSRTSGYWRDEYTISLQGYLQSTYYFPNLFGIYFTEAVNILIEAGYNIDTDPEYGWVLYTI